MKSMPGWMLSTPPPLPIPQTTRRKRVVRLVGSPSMPDRVLEGRVEEILPVLDLDLDRVGVDDEGLGAPVVAAPVAVGVLGTCPGRRSRTSGLYGAERPSVFGLDGEGDARRRRHPAWPVFLDRVELLAGAVLALVAVP